MPNIQILKQQNCLIKGTANIVPNGPIPSNWSASPTYILEVTFCSGTDQTLNNTIFIISVAVATLAIGA